VTLVDVDRERIRRINEGEATLQEPGLQELIRDGLAQDRLRATTELGPAVMGSDVSILSVGTPLRKGRIDLSFVRGAAEEVGRALRTVGRYHVVVVKSTVVPGTTQTVLRPVLEETSGMRAGAFGLCVNPEFLREGSAVRDFMDPDRIVIGAWDDRCALVLERLYESFSCPKLRTSLAEAELGKYVSNALLATLISFSNEIAGLCEGLPDTDVETVMGSVHLDRRLTALHEGLHVPVGICAYLRAGAGFGGSCLPKDVGALRAHARERGIPTRLLDAVAQVNRHRAEIIVRLTGQLLGSLRGRTIAQLGLAFKPGTDDLRDSPAITILKRLRSSGADVRVYDPVVPSSGDPALRRVVLASSPEEALEGVDAALIVTDWPQFSEWDWGSLSSRMRQPVIIDARNTLRRTRLPDHILYRPIGRCLGSDG